MAIKINSTIVIDDDSNVVGVAVSASSLFNIPSGDTGSRRVSPVSGEIRYNSETTNFEMYNGTDWLLVNTVPE